MVEAGKNCTDCNAVFKIAYEQCPICELEMLVDMSEFDSKESLRSEFVDDVNNLSPSTRRYLGFD